MKCDKLQQVENPIEWGLYYDKNEVDAAIAELKEVYKDSVDVKVKIWERYKKAEDELRRLKRALYKACANWADVVAFEETEGIGHDNSVAERWRKMESKCRAKAKEYK